MRIILEDFMYGGYHIERWESELPQVNRLEDVTEEMLYVYIIEQLDDYVSFNNSFYEYEKA